MRLALFGLPKRTVRFLPELLRGPVEVAGIYLSEPYEGYFPQIEALAQAYKIPCHFPVDPNDPTLPGKLLRASVDLLVSINFTKKLPRTVLHAARKGGVNLHPSLLPLYRGPNPYFWVLRNGEAETGVTSHYMEEVFDSGPILVQRRVKIEPEETLGSLLPRLEAVTEEVLFETLKLVTSDPPAPGTPQDPALVTLAPQVKETDLRLDFQQPTNVILRHIRACNPAYGAWAGMESRAVKIFAATQVEETAPPTGPGTVVLLNGRPLIATADGLIYPEVMLLDEGGFFSGEQLMRSGILRPGTKFE